VAFERAEGFALGLALADAPLEVGASLGLVLARMIAIVWIALFAWRSPPRLSRCRTVWPEDAGSGARPVAAREGGFVREAAGVAGESFAAEIGPMPGSSRSVSSTDRTSAASSRRSVARRWRVLATVRARSRMTPKIARACGSLFAATRIAMMRRSSCLPVPLPTRRVGRLGPSRVLLAAG